MNIINKKVLFVLFSFLTFSILFTSCGYKPSVHYAKQELNGTVFVKLLVDLKDPKNTVLIKDSMNKLLVQKLGNRLVYDEKLADNIMFLNLNSVKMQTIQYDGIGYNKLYKAFVNIFVSYTKKDTNKKNSFSVQGENTFSIDDGSTISDAKRFLAIKNASDDALNEVLSKIAVISFQK